MSLGRTNRMHKVGSTEHMQRCKELEHSVLVMVVCAKNSVLLGYAHEITLEKSPQMYVPELNASLQFRVLLVLWRPRSATPKCASMAY